MEMDTDIPAGYRRKWVPEGDDWKVGGGDRKCRMLRCQKPAVAALRRTRRNASKLTPYPTYIGQWWHYCEDHMYGRRINNGVVESLRLVPETLTEAQED
jgi:hypothetical protein